MPPIANRKSQIANGFTLVELIISIALVLVVMLGINFVFKMTGDTIGAGQVLNDQVRNNRGAQAIMFDDFGKVMRDGPYLNIRSRGMVAYRNAADEAADSDADPGTVDLDGDGAFNSFGERVSLGATSTRSHRIDIISFFAQGLFRRQTGNDGELVSDVTSNECMIWYGHLIQPTNEGSFYLGNVQANGKTNPGAGNKDTNPNNYYAATWSLGRVGMLMREPVGGQILDRSLDPQAFIVANPAAGNLTPFSLNSSASGSIPGAGTFEIQDCRYDLAGISAARYRSKLANEIQINSGNPTYNWWTPLLLGQPNGSRFECNPAVIRPLSSRSYSQQAPMFLRNCTQFIVEFAGDFVAQDTDAASAGYGDVLDAFYSPNANHAGSTDGQLDFIVVNGSKRVRWYGFPRDSNGDGSIPGFAATRRNNSLVDVVPLRDVIQTMVGANQALYAGTNAPFERQMTAAPAALPLPSAGARGLTGLASDYAGVSGIAGSSADGLALANHYTCAWGPNDTVRPKLIRVTMVLDDPAGRMAEGQTLEYVFELP